MNLRRLFSSHGPVRTKSLLAFSTFLLLVCLITVILSPTPVLRSYETESILAGSTRSEYYILNRKFFEFLSRTNMECHVQVEPGEKWSNEASVITKLFDRDSSSYNTQGEEDTNIMESDKCWPTINIDKNKSAESPRKYILAYRHFEQLGKTVENLIQLTALAKRWRRSVVMPDVKNSRFSLELGSHSYPMDVYFKMDTFNRLLYENGYAKLVGLGSFLRDCSLINSRQVKTTLVHFLYNDYHKGNTKLWYHLNDTSFQQILSKSRLTGWTECAVINKHLGLSKRFQGISVGRQLCVNPEIITSEIVLEESILKGDKCVIFVEWRGFGTSRTHFSLKYMPFCSPRKIKHALSPSHLIDQEVIAFKKKKLASDYISVHIRSERMFAGYTFERLKLCIDHIVHVVNILRELRGVVTVFLATDMTRFGSDAFDRHNYYTTNATGRYRLHREDLARFHVDVATRLHAITYAPTRKPFSKDKGIVSLVEMNILKGGIDLVSVGSGTFHAWLLSEFRQQQKQHGRRGYTISEICAKSNGNS